jgi:hypothetical protein
MRQKTREQKALAEQNYQLRVWKRWRRERIEALLAGRYGEAAGALLAFLPTMSAPSALIDFVAAGPWADADADTRTEVLALIDAAIIKRRERAGLPPFDDPLPGKQPGAFLILREQLVLARLRTAPTGAQPGSKTFTTQTRNRKCRTI